MRRRDFFKRLGTVSAAVAVPAVTMAAVAVKSAEPEAVTTVKTNSGHYTRILVKEGKKYKMSYDCKIGPGETFEVQNVSVHEAIEDHYMKGVGVMRINGY